DPYLALLELPEAPGQPLPPDDLELARLRALPPPRNIPAGWRIGSFSALAQGAGHVAGGEGAAADHDNLVRPVAREPLPKDLPADDILRFPRGAAAGDCLHAPFE